MPTTGKPGRVTLDPEDQKMFPKQIVSLLSGLQKGQLEAVGKLFLLCAQHCDGQSVNPSSTKPRTSGSPKPRRRKTGD